MLISGFAFYFSTICGESNRRFLTRFFVQCHPKTELGSFPQENVDSADFHRDQSLGLS